jgi:radical SAM superfamily enzyme YgiQ (UPF0313 family)
LAVLATAAQERGFEVEVCHELSEKVSRHQGNYDIVAISCATAAFPHACELAAVYRKRGAWVVMGGYHPSARPEEAGMFADTVVVGAADGAFPAFLDDWLVGCPKPRYDGADHQATALVPARDVIPRKGYVKYAAPILTGRGCPYHCAFCSTTVQMSASQARPVDQVLDEIRRIYRHNLIFFDPSFFSDHAYAKDLMDGLSGLSVRWIAAVTVTDALRTDLLDAAARGGCRGLLLGLESLQQATLSSAGKAMNNPQRYAEAISNIRARGIAVNGCFVMGLDGDTESDLLDLPRQVASLGLTVANFWLLTPFPGTKLFSDFEAVGRITTTDWSLYDEQHVVYTPTEIAPERLVEIYRDVWRRTYSFPAMARRSFGVRPATLMERLTALGVNLGFRFTVGKK